MPALNLTPAERAAHRGAAHHLEPVAMIGAGGLTDAVVAEIDAALKAHGLIKVRALAGDRAQREAWLAELAERLHAAPVQHIGKLLVLWRPKPAKEKAADPQRKPGPREFKVIKPAKQPGRRPDIKTVRVLGNQRLTPGGLVKKAKKRQKSAKKAAAARSG
ncbi:RNA-binding protein [Tepidimonas alkaliphilus]|uniref:RNA-binding protein n=1 Tax=Tepidimonas alkaliphilus TaxID=2588942 RepID=A0A554WDF1_9BURK|nr:YhbY family RNA-binding protein [Tepidimonas alkaliphilus]TSE21596.1 RNA-binding protein [Tepidimonas alkaliphilus]